MRKGSSAHFTRPRHIDMELVAVGYRSRDFPMHIHEQYVVGAIENGAEKLDVDGKTYVISEGEMITLNPGQAHSNATLGNDLLQYRVFYLPPQLVEEFAGRSDLRFDAVSRTDASDAHRLLQLHRWFQIEPGDRLEQESAVSEIVHIAFAAAGQPEREDPLPEAVRLARRYIDEHFRESFGLDDLAQAAGASKFHLTRSFTRAQGLSPFAYRTHRRINEARRMLLTGTPLVDIAADLGFSDQSHMTRQFQSIVGISPARYREQ